MLIVEHITKTYQSGDQRITVLNDVSVHLETGTTCAIVGPSGSGKTTMLSLCAGLDRPDAGSIRLYDFNLHTLAEDQLAWIRAQYVGFVFQTFRLIPTLTALENVMVPLELLGRQRAEQAAFEQLRQVDLADRAHHYPSQLSGGEQQRVALARAFVHTPKILFADEPTGNLDAQTGDRVISLLFRLNRNAGTTLMLVTHDPELARRTDRIVALRAGRLLEETARRDLNG